MNIRNITLMLLTLLTISTAHAEGYTFTDNTSFTPDDPYRWIGHTMPKPEVTTRTQNISGTTGVISDLNVTLHNITTRAFADMTFVLVGPGSTGVVLASHAGGHGHGGPLTETNITVKFDDEAATKIFTPPDDEVGRITETIESGSYKTTANLLVPYWLAAYDRRMQYSIPQYVSGITTSNPVKDGIFPGVSFSETNQLSAFNDISANGSWKLLAYDNISYRWSNNGSYMYGEASPTLVAGGWSLDINTTSGAVPEPAEWMLIGLCACGIIILKFKPHLSGLKFTNKH